MLLKSRKRTREVKSAFEEEDEDDEKEEVQQAKNHGASAKQSARKAQIRAVNARLKQAERQTGLQAERAVAEAREQGMENAFHYDQGFEEFSSSAKQKRKEEQEMKNQQEPKKSLYISRLLETARQRDLQHEIAIEKAKRKEREAESEQLGGGASEVFVTSAYKKRLEERAQFEQAERMRENEEKKEKEQGMGRFYGHLLGSITNDTQTAPEEKPHTQAANNEATLQPANYADANSKNNENANKIHTGGKSNFEESKTSLPLHQAESEPKPQGAPKSRLSSSYLESARKRAIQRAKDRGALFIGSFVSAEAF